MEREWANVQRCESVTHWLRLQLCIYNHNQNSAAVAENSTIGSLLKSLSSYHLRQGLRAPSGWVDTQGVAWTSASGWWSLALARAARRGRADAAPSWAGARAGGGGGWWRGSGDRCGGRGGGVCGRLRRLARGRRRLRRAPPVVLLEAVLEHLVVQALGHQNAHHV